MKKLKACTKIFVASIICLLLSFSFFTPHDLYANAEEMLSITTSKDAFSIQTFAQGRGGHRSLLFNHRQQEDKTNHLIDFYCLNWSELEDLNFSISSATKGTEKLYKNFSIYVTSLQDDNLGIPLSEASIAVCEQKSLIYSTNILNNANLNLSFRYYIDSSANVDNRPLSAKGTDFGLYKFTFAYSFIEENVTITDTIGDLYIAVLPDDIEEIARHSHTRIIYSISSSNKLLNVFNLSLETNAFDYVNPKNIEWLVTGTDKEKNEYVLTLKQKQENSRYANCRVIWTSIASNYGTHFIFDSNDIEGTWTAYCILKDDDGQQITSFSVDDLSTIKASNRSLTWLWIVLTVVGAMGLAGGGLLIVLKKRDKVW